VSLTIFPKFEANRSLGSRVMIGQTNRQTEITTLNIYRYRYFLSCRCSVLLYALWTMGAAQSLKKSFSHTSKVGGWSFFFEILYFVAIFTFKILLSTIFNLDENKVPKNPPNALRRVVSRHIITTALSGFKN